MCKNRNKKIAPGVGSNYTDIWVINRELIKSVDNDTWKELHDIYKEELRNKIGFSDLKEKMKCKSHVGKVSNEVLK
jgi:diketogulonate reductase-like aldo/keto reductase